MNIRFLYFEGCPNQEKALNLLREVIKSKGIDENIQPLFGCRVYFYNGKYQGVPPKKLIEKAIDETLNA